MASNIFTGIEKVVNESLEAFKNVTLSDEFTWIQSAIVGAVGLMITYKGYQTLAGQSQSPIKELVWDISKKLLIMMFVLNLGGWLTQVNDVCTDFYNWASGGENLYQKLDAVTDKYVESMGKFYKAISVGFFKDTVIIGPVWCMICLTIGFIVIIASLAFTLITAELTNTVLIMILPLALFFLMWERTKQIFGQWLNLFISNLITLIIYSTAMKLVEKKFEATFTITENVNSNTFPFFDKGISIIFTAMMFVVLIKMATGIAQSLAQVSLDAGAGAIVGGMGAAAAGAAGGAAGLVGKAGMKAGGATLGAMGSYASSVGKAGMSGASAAGAGFTNKMKGFMKGAAMQGSGINSTVNAYKSGKENIKNAYQKTKDFINTDGIKQN